MDQKPRRVRKFKLHDPQQAYDPAIARMTPSHRVALVFEASKRLFAMRGQTIDERRLPRHAMRVEKRQR